MWSNNSKSSDLATDSKRIDVRALAPAGRILEREGSVLINRAAKTAAGYPTHRIRWACVRGGSVLL